MIEEFGIFVKNKISSIRSILRGSTTEDLPTSVFEILRSIGFSEIEITELIKQNAVFKFVGATSDKPSNSDNEIFVPILFISHDEFISLQAKLSKIGSNDYIGNRPAYYQALKDLASAVFGTDAVDQKEIQTLMAQLYGIPFKPSSLDGIKIIDILEPKRVSKEQLENYVNDFKQRLSRLEKIPDNKNYRFLSNGLKYYWIPVEELP